MIVRPSPSGGAIVHFVIAVVGFALLCGCRTDSEKLDDALSSPESIDVDTLVSLCQRLGPDGTSRIRKAADSSTDSRIVVRLLQALLICDVNAHLEYAIKALGKCNAWYGPILETLVGGLDQESERIIEGIARASHGREFEVAANIYGMISDSPQALELARTRFSEADQTDTHEMVGAITFLGQAACCNHDESAADLLLPYLENNPYQTVARETLSGMPGDRAEALFLDYARRKPALTESYILKLLDRRRHPLSARERCACGWKREIHPQQK